MAWDSLSLPLELSPPATLPHSLVTQSPKSFWDLLIPRDLVDGGLQLPGEEEMVEDTK